MVCSPSPLEQVLPPGHTQGNPAPITFLGVAHTATVPSWNGIPVVLLVWGYLAALAFFLQLYWVLPWWGLCGGLFFATSSAFLLPL